MRPARSALGKQVVSVQYLKDGGRDSYLIKGIGQDSWKGITKAELDSRLARLHDTGRRRVDRRRVMTRGELMCYRSQAKTCCSAHLECERAPMKKCLVTGAFGKSPPPDQTPQDTIQRPTTICGVSKLRERLVPGTLIWLSEGWD